MSDISLAVVDPNTLFRAGLVSLLSAMGFGAVEDGASVAELRERIDGRLLRGRCLWLPVEGHFAQRPGRKPASGLRGGEGLSVAPGLDDVDPEQSPRRSGAERGQAARV